MKKITAAAFTVFITVLLIFAALKNRGSSPPENIKAGMTFVDFAVTMKNSALVSLKELAGGNYIILSFTDSFDSSSKFQRVFESRKKEILSRSPSLLWFNIKKEGKHAVIEEITGRLRLKYKTLYSEIPGVYNFSNRPSVIVIDKTGIIRMVYLGYSPSIINDVLHEITELPE